MLHVIIVHKLAISLPGMLEELKRGRIEILMRHQKRSDLPCLFEAEKRNL